MHGVTNLKNRKVASMIFGKASSKVGDTFSLLDPKIWILKTEFMNLPHFLHDDFFAWLISFLTIFAFWILRSTAVVLVAFCNKANGPKSWNTPGKVNIYKLGVGPRLVPCSIYQSSAPLFKKYWTRSSGSKIGDLQNYKLLILILWHLILF